MPLDRPSSAGPRPHALPHRVGRVSFEIEGPDEREIFALRARLEAEGEGMLTEALEEAFSDVADSDEVIVLDRLEVDLGTLTAGSLDATRLRRALVEVLAHRFSASAGPGEGTAVPRRIHAPMALAEALARFLLTGRLDWRSPSPTVADLMASLGSLAAPDFDRVGAALRPALEREVAIQRLTLQIDVELALRLLRAAGLPKIGAPAGGWIARLQATRGSVAESREVAREILVLLHEADGHDRVASPAGTVPRDGRPARPAAPAGIADGDAGQDVGDRADRTRLPDEPPVDMESDAAAPLYVAHAGLVLLHPFLAALFRACGLLSEEMAFTSDDAGATAIHLLYATATGRSAPEEIDLVLPKLLCGAPLDAPMPREIEPHPAHLAEVTSMLDAVIANWVRLGSTSRAGLRETFLARGGRLDGGPQGWRLTVERRGVDILLDALPWGLSVIRLPWMRQPLFVNWG